MSSRKRTVAIPSPVSGGNPTLRRLGTRDVAAFRALRLKAIKDVPHAFGASLADEKRTTDETYRSGFGIGARSGFVLGAFVDGHLAGVVGFRRFSPGNLKHKGAVWGMYVAQEHRRQGIGAALLRDCLARAEKAPGLELIQLAVESGNKSAIGLYRRAGFWRYAVEKGALKVRGAYYDEDLMQAQAKG